MEELTSALWSCICCSRGGEVQPLATSRTGVGEEVPSLPTSGIDVGDKVPSLAASGIDVGDEMPPVAASASSLCCIKQHEK